LDDRVDGSNEHDGQGDEELKEERIVGLFADDRVSEHPDDDQDNDDVGDEEENISCSTE
jgi:hypothetical protein